MAKINVEFDTKEKTMAVSIDGQEVADAYSVCLYRGYYEDEKDKFSCSITTVQQDKDNDMRVITQTMAKQSVEAQQEMAQSKLHPEFVETKEKKEGNKTVRLLQAVANYFQRD